MLLSIAGAFPPLRFYLTFGKRARKNLRLFAALQPFGLMAVRRRSIYNPVRRSRGVLHYFIYIFLLYLHNVLLYVYILFPNVLLLYISFYYFFYTLLILFFYFQCFYLYFVVPFLIFPSILQRYIFYILLPRFH